MLSAPNSATSASSASALMSIAATRAPSRTKRSPPAPPMPDAEAVTAASLPSTRICLSLHREAVGEPPRRRYAGGLGFEAVVETSDPVITDPVAGLDDTKWVPSAEEK